MADGKTFTPAEDVTEEYKNKRGRGVVAQAGVPIPWARARALGLIDGASQPRVEGTIQEPPSEVLDTLHGVDVPVGDLAADLAEPRTIDMPDAPRLTELAGGDTESIRTEPPTRTLPRQK